MPLSLLPKTFKSFFGMAYSDFIYPNIFTKDYFLPRLYLWEEQWNNLIVSTGDSTKALMSDNNNVTQWSSVGSDDTTTESILLRFYNGDTVIDRDFDTVFLFNHNFKRFRLYYEDGGNYVLIKEILDNTDTNSVIRFSSVTSDYIKIEIDTTQTVDAEKVLGEVKVMEHILTLPDFDLFNPDRFDGGGLYRLKNGGLIKYNEYERWKCRFGFRFLPQTTIDLLYTELFKPKVEFGFYPEPIERPDEVFIVHWVSPYGYPYSTRYKGAGYTHEIEVEEV